MDTAKPKLHVVSFSGGKDSTAMLLKMQELGMQIDLVLFCDTGLEFPQLYEHIHKVSENTGLKITTLKSEYSFEYLMLEKPFKRRNEKYKGKLGRSWAHNRYRWCTKMLKTDPREKFLRKIKKDFDIIEYIGIAADETHRLNRECNKRDGKRLPLVEWNMTEADCLEYCYGKGYDWGGLYEKFSRVSCWCCPLQPLDELRILYSDFPKLWEQLKKWDNATWRTFRAEWSVEQLERRFDFEKEWIAKGKNPKSKDFYKALEKIKNSP